MVLGQSLVYGARRVGGGRPASPQPAGTEVFTAVLIYTAQVFIWETSRLRADTAIARDLQT